MGPFFGMVSPGWFATMMARTRSCISKLSTDRSWSGFTAPVFEKAAMTSLIAPSSFSPFLRGSMMRVSMCSFARMGSLAIFWAMSPDVMLVTTMIAAGWLRQCFVVDEL